MVPRIYWTFLFAALFASQTTSSHAQTFSSHPIPNQEAIRVSSRPYNGIEIDFLQKSGSQSAVGTATRKDEAAKMGIDQPIKPVADINSQLIQPPNENAINQAVVGSQSASIDLTNQPERLVTGLWYGSFDAMFLSRSGPDPQVLVFTNGVPSFSTADFSYSSTFSPAASIAMGDPWGFALEFTYLNSSHDFDGVVSGTNVVPIFFGGVPAVPVSSYTIDASAQMDNYELTQWVRLNDRIRMGLGLRIIDMNEEYNITETGTSSGFFAEADNELFGAQFAAQYVIFANQIAAIYLQGRSGLYYNSVSIDARSSNFQITPSSNEFSWVGDLRAVVDMPLTRMISFRFGYQGTLLTNIAQALDQNDDLDITNAANPGTIDFSSLSYTGGFIGVIGNY